MILVQHILNGDQQAEKEFYNKYRKIIKDFIRSKYSLYYDIEDDVSEILIKAFYSLNTFDSSKSKLKSWVCTIAKNYMIDKWRNNSLSVTSYVPDYSSNEITVTSNCSCYYTNCDAVINTISVDSAPLSFTMSNNASWTTCNTDFENCNSVTYLSSQISPEDFSLLNMKYVQGYNYCEIGKEFQLTSSTVSNRINYIKTKLKKNNKEDVFG